MRLNFGAFLLLLLGGCSGVGSAEPRMPPPSPDWGSEGALREEAEVEGERDLPPVALIISPPKGTRYRVGDAIAFVGRGSDLEDGGLLASAFTWQVDFHAGDRVIPFVPPISGVGRGVFIVPAREEAEGPGWYRIHLKLTDSHGNTHVVFRDVYPWEPEPEPRRSALVR